MLARAPISILLAAVSLLVSISAQDDGAFPEHFKLKDALNYYSVESTSLIKRSLLHAGFSAGETLEIDDTYLDFATRALNAEKKRIQRIRKALKEKQASEASQTCQGDSSSGQCIQKDDRLSEFEHFLTPDLAPGQADLLRWEDDGSIVQDYAARIGLPDTLIPTLRAYAEDMGLMEIMTNMLYDDPLPPDGNRWFSFQSPYQTKEGVDSAAIRNFTWNVERPAKKWKSDMHWFNTADELAHEDSLRALAKGGFDQVLDGIGKKFGLDTLHVDSLGFVAVTNCERGFIHTDWEDVDGGAFNFLVGIASPEDAGPELVVENVRKGEVHYGSNAGILVGDGTRHGTRECDHRAKRGVRITCSIYLADLNEKNLAVVAGDTTSTFPPTGDEDWIWAQRGRHWSKDGSRSLVGDLGRKEMEVKDSMMGCEERTKHNECLGDSKERAECWKSCRVFIPDDEYKPGEERRQVLGY